jgi:hypothetical protein
MSEISKHKYSLEICRIFEVNIIALAFMERGELE